ncbi:bestrophin family ion channel [Novosphingobium sp. AP12]|uniref:bestrophin family ion channel n=1 Tax=Novosphingobium sp. AP12 TaxID=1144305 RepID=UPI00055CCF2A
MFCLTLPFKLGGALGLGASWFVAQTSFALVGDDVPIDKLEDPFGHEQNNVLLDAIVSAVQMELGPAPARSTTRSLYTRFYLA